MRKINNLLEINKSSLLTIKERINSQKKKSIIRGILSTSIGTLILVIIATALNASIPVLIGMIIAGLVSSTLSETANYLRKTKFDRETLKEYKHEKNKSISSNNDVNEIENIEDKDFKLSSNLKDKNNDREALKEPSIKKTFLILTGLLLGGTLLAINFGSILIFLTCIGTTLGYIIRTIKKSNVYYKLLESGQIIEEEKKSILSKVKDKIKTFGKRKKKYKEITPKNTTFQKASDNKTIKDNTNINNIKNNKVTRSKIIEELENMRNSIIDGQYGLKKDQIIQDRVNAREINNYYKKYTNVELKKKDMQKVYKKTL